MDARHLLLMVTLGIVVPTVCLAKLPLPGKIKSEICGGPTTPPPSDWVVEHVRNSQEYPGIVEQETHMTLQSHDHPNSNNEWQIVFSGNKPTSPKPPGVEILHFIKVCGGSDLDENLPHPNDAYLDIAYRDIMKNKHNYYVAMGYLDGIPTLALLTLSKVGTGGHRHFNLVFVKAEQARLDKIRQGGVIHGQGN